MHIGNMMEGNMEKIELHLDENLISKDDRDDLKKIFQRVKIKTEVSEVDTHAMGGISWFPTDLVLIISGMTAAGFLAALGEDLYNKLKHILIRILKREKPHNERIRQFYFAFDHPEIRLYFEVFEFFSDNINYFIDKIKSDYSLLLKQAIEIKKMKLESIGMFDSITYHFDEDEDRWIIAHFNKHK